MPKPLLQSYLQASEHISIPVKPPRRKLQKLIITDRLSGQLPFELLGLPQEKESRQPETIQECGHLENYNHHQLLNVALAVPVLQNANQRSYDIPTNNCTNCPYCRNAVISQP